MAASKKDVAKQQVKEDREKVREMYLSGKTVKEIAKETYFSSSYCYAMVRDLAKEKNLAKKAKRAPLNEAMIQDAKAGMTVAEIAKKHGVTYQQCYYTVSEYTQRRYFSLQDSWRLALLPHPPHLLRKRFRIHLTAID